MNTNLVDERHDICGNHFVRFVLLFPRRLEILIYFSQIVKMLPRFSLKLEVTWRMEMYVASGLN